MNIDLALCIEKLVPQAKYSGSTTENTKEAYDNLVWEDERPKPSWSDILRANELLLQKTQEQNEIEEKIQQEIRAMAIERLVSKGEITREKANKLLEVDNAIKER